MSQLEQKDPRSYAVIGAAMEVHKELGPGFLEAIYQEAMEMELDLRTISYLSQPEVKIFYKGKKMKKFYKPDFICFNDLVIEIKAEKTLTKVDETQVINVLKSTRHHTGLLINFGEPSLIYRRFVNGKP